jgi:hypothetical protein
LVLCCEVFGGGKKKRDYGRSILWKITTIHDDL